MASYIELHGISRISRIEGAFRTNIGRIRVFYLAYSISPQAVSKLEGLPIFNIPWGHNIAIFEGIWLDFWIDKFDILYSPPGIGSPSPFGGNGRSLTIFYAFH
jgi:hypothetical protein